jgi:hypothetical protein
VLAGGHRPERLHAKGVREYLARAAVRHAIIVCAQAEAQCPKMYPFAGETLYWAFDETRWRPEPSAELQLAKFRRVRDEIDTRLRGGYATFASRTRCLCGTKLVTRVPVLDDQAAHDDESTPRTDRLSHRPSSTI